VHANGDPDEKAARNAGNGTARLACKPADNHSRSHYGLPPADRAEPKAETRTAIIANLKELN